MALKARELARPGPVPTTPQRPGRQLRRHSLRWRLPLIFGALIVLVLTAFLWATYRQVERTLVQTGAERAAGVAAELAERLGGSIGNAMTQSERLASEAAVRAFVERPTDANRAAAIAVLPASAPGLRRLELWDTAGTLLLEVASPSSRPDTAVVLRSYPAIEAPDRGGIGHIRAAAEFNFFDVVAEVRDSSAAGVAPIGFIRRYGQVSSSGMQIRNLLGDDAILRIGSTDGNVWTDFYTIVDAPPTTDGRDAPGVYRAPDGRRWVGAGAPVGQTPWLIWIGYPRSVILAPAQTFLSRMLGVAALLVLASAAMAAALGIRLTRPLHALAGAADEIAAGHYTRVAGDGRDEIGRLSHAFNTMSDRIQLAHGALRESNERTQFALAAAGIGVWECQLATGRIRCTDSMRLVLGLTDDPLPDTRGAFLDLVHAEDRDIVRQALEGRGVEEQGFDVCYRTIVPGVAFRWIEGKARLRLDAAGAPVSVLGVSLDATARHRLEAQLRQSQKMDAIGQLAGGVAHDFNNLLTAIVGHGNLVLAELAADTPVREDVVEILRASESAATLTRQLLTFSRRQLVVPQVVEVHIIIAQTQRLIRRLIDADIGIITDLAADIDTVRIDPGQLEQVIVNLAVNARDAMPDGGTLRIATANVHIDADHMLLSAGLSPGPYVVLSVSDTGVGMDAETQNRLFEPFFTTKAPGKGTGLGLATVFGIIKQSGGHITVYSEPSRGTTFRIYLPPTADRITPSPARASVSTPAGGGESILVVEDNTAVRAIAKTILERAGYRVTVATDGEEALRILAVMERPDLIVTDVVMPGMTGPELSRKISALYGDINVLFTSGYAGDALSRHGMQASETQFIEKPYSPVELTKKVREALGGTRNVRG
jgi:signal transduction histidine kinase/ActR/RegA family two-component response regulator